MKRLLPALLAGLGLALAGCSDVTVDQPSKPNIVFIFVDDMGYGDLGITGNQDVPTVNMDRLAEDGIRFTQFYVASPICSPSRVGIMRIPILLSTLLPFPFMRSLPVRHLLHLLRKYSWLLDSCYQTHYKSHLMLKFQIDLITTYQAAAVVLP